MKKQILNSNNAESNQAQTVLDKKIDRVQEQIENERPESVSCKNGVCLVTWKPVRPAA